MGKIKSGIRGLILLVIASSALFLTCDIGLGRSVDTKPPSLAISYPPVQSIIKNSFTMSGEAADDTALASVSVTAVNTSTAVSYGPYAATIDPATGTWSVVVNNKTESGFELKDGIYEMTVAALDGASRKSVATTTYEIDNTAPVVVIERPGTYGPIAYKTDDDGFKIPTNAETYGTELKLTGSVNDDHAIDKLVFTAYDEAGNQVGSPLVQTNISGVAMDIILAKYFSSPANSDEIALNNLYNSIYTGYYAEGKTYKDQGFYCTITVSDAAREYNPPAASASADNSRGNINSAYYLYDDIYSQVFADTGFAVTMKDLTAIFNGSYADAAKAQSVLAVLAEKARPASTWSTASASFSLNPTNSPSYEVKGFSPINNDSTSKYYNPIAGMKKTNGTDLTILVKAGRDGVPLLPDTLKVYLDPCGSSGDTPDPNATDIVLLNTVAELGSDTTAIAARAAKITKSGTDYQIFVNIGAIATKTNYRLRVEGSDQNGKTFPEMDYGFRVITNGKPPVVTIGSTLPADLPDPTPANLDTINKSTVTCIGYVTSETGLVSLPATVTVLNTVTNIVVATHTVDLSSVGSALTATKWTLPIDIAADTTTVGLYQYTVALTATDEEGNSTAATRIFYVDREPPKVEFNTPTPVVNVAGTNYVNGTIRWSGRITDNYGVYSASYSLDGGLTFTPIANPISWTTADIDTRNYDDPMGVGTLTLTVAMTDKAGNTALGSTSILIDQATDKPVITLSNANTSGLITNPANVDKDHNLFGRLTNNRIYGTIKDDDKLGATVTVMIDGTAVNAEQITIASPGSTYSVDYAPKVSGAALSEGIHTIEFVAVDESGVSNTTGVFYIGVDEAPPTLEITSPAQNSFCSGTLSVTGNALDSSGVVTLVRKESSPPDTAIAVAGDNSWSDSLPVGTTTGTYTRYYTATDKYGRTTNVGLTYQIDSTPPTVAVTTPLNVDPLDLTPPAPVYVKKENVYQILGTASDVGSSVTSVFYKIQTAAAPAPTTVDGSWETAVGTGNWTANVNLSNNVTYPEGDYKVYIASKDSAGNFSALSPQPIAVETVVLIHADQNAPNVSVTTPPPAYVKGTIDILGTATDTNIDTVTYTRSAGNSANSQGPTTPTYDGTNWSIHDSLRSDGVTPLSDDSYTYTITATDKAGRTSTAQVSTIKDTAAPMIEISSITKQIVANSKTNNVNGVITVKGTISDNDKVATGTYTLQSDGVDVPGYVNVSLGANLTSWSFTVDTTMAGITDLRDLAITINATDRASNVATPKTQTVFVDQSTDKPVIALSNVDTTVSVAGGVTATKNLFDTTGNNKLLGTISDDDGIKSYNVLIVNSLSATVVNDTTNVAGAPTTASLSYTLPATEDVYSVAITVTDTTTSAVSTVTGTFYVGVDAGAPELAITSPAQNTFYSGAISVQGTATDGSKVVTLVRKGTPDVGVTIAAEAWTDPLNVGTTTTPVAKTVYYEATDKYGKKTVVGFTYKVDGDRPEITVSTPADTTPADGVPDATYIKKESVYPIVGGSSDVGSAVTKVIYKILPAATAAPASADDTDPTWLTAVGTASWTANVNLSSNVDYPEGSYKVYVASKDLAGNYSVINAARTVTLYADKDVPALSVTPPAAYQKGTTITFTGGAGDTYFKELSYTRTGLTDPVVVATTAGAAASWTVNDAIPAGTANDGTYVYTFTVTDHANRSKDFAYTVTRDSDPPVIEITSITKQLVKGADSNVVNGTITVKGTISDNDKVATGTYSLTSGGTAVAGAQNVTVGANLTNWQFTVNTKGAGITDNANLVIAINATDRAGNSAVVATQTVRVDQSTDTPVIAITTPSSGDFVGANHVVRGTVSDDDGVNADKIEISYDSGTSWHAISTSGGTVSGSTTEPATERTFAFTLPALGADGAKQVRVRAYDTDGYSGTPALSSAVNFSLDTTDPVINVTAPATNDIAYTTGFGINGNVVETYLDTLTLSIDGGAKATLVSGGTGSQNWSSDAGFAGLSEGRHTARLVATDKVGRSVSVERSFYKDTNGPAITFSNLTAGATPASAILTPDSIRGTVSDIYSTPATTFQYRFDTDPADPEDILIPASIWQTGTVTVVSSSGTWDIAIPAGLAEGAHTVTVRCADALGNLTTSAAIGFRLDRDIPDISFTAPTKTLYNADFTLKCTSTDENAIAKREYYVDNALIGTIMDDVDFTIGAGAQATGSHSVKIVATDGVGRTAQVVFSYMVDKTAPTAYITGITPLADTSKINGTVAIAANATDDNGIDGYAYATTDNTVAVGTDVPTLAWIPFLAGTVTHNFDTTAVPGWEDTTRRIWVRAADKAGNYGYVYQDRVIDQDSDRPLVKLSNISGGATDVTKYPYPTTLKNSNILYGTVIDDDGITSIKIKDSLAGTFAAVTLEGSAWEYTASSGDGAKTLYFQIVDSTGKTFETAAAVPVATATDTGRPRIQRPSGDPLDTTAPVDFKVDTVTPEIGSTLYVDRMTPYTYAADAYTVPLTTNLPFGGSSAKFSVRALATDSNGIKEVYVKIDGIGVPIPTTAGFDSALTIPASAIVKGGVYKIATLGSTHFDTEFGASANTVGTTFTASRAGIAGDTGTVMPQVYDTAEISVAALAVDSTIVTIEATDNSGLKSTATRTIIVDNVKPSVTHSTPKNNDSSDQVNGDVTVKGVASDSGSGLKSLKYQIGLSADLSESSAEWKDVGGSLLSWQVDFKDGVISGDPGIVPTKIDVYAGQGASLAVATDTFTLNGHGLSNGDVVYFGGAVTLPSEINYTTGYYVINGTENTFQISASSGGSLITFAGSDTTVYVSKYSKDLDNSGIWQLPIVLRAEDNAGNVLVEATSDYLVRVDPSGDRPVVTVIYPAPATSPTLGGNIRIFGSAIDDDEVKEIYMQIDVDGQNGYDANDADYEGVTTNWYNGGDGVLISGTASWNQTINTSGDLNPISGVTSDPRVIHFRVRAKDKYGTYGAWSTSQTIYIDTKAPKIGSSETPTLVQGGVQKPYVADTWLKGTWYLTASVEDESDIFSVETVDAISGGPYSKTFAAGAGTWFVDVPTGTFPAPNNGYRLNIPLVTSGTGSLSFTINATDNGDKRSSSYPISLRYDNTEPTLDPYTGNVPIVQSNKIYTLSSSVRESGSGFSKLAFYFTRTFASGGTYVYNPMIAKLSAGQKSQIDGTTIKTIDGLPCLVLTEANVNRASTYSLTDADLIGNPNVRLGGLVRIGGYYHLITAFDSGTGKVTWDDAEVAITEKSAAIAYAQVVNNTKTESPANSADPLALINGDDKDGMIESIERAGDVYYWTASLDSRNIPDGPIDINCVAFDNAGNISAIKTYPTFVQNNGPRIVKLTLGTDLNGDGTVSASEKLNTYSDANKPTTFPASSEDFIAKGLMSADIETIGGNGALNYVVERGVETPTELIRLPTFAPSDASGSTITMAGHPFKELQLVYLDATTLPTGVSRGSYYVRDVTANSFAISTSDTGASRVNFTNKGTDLNFSGLGTILVPAAMLGTDTEGGDPTTFTYTIWDRTEELIIGSSTQKAVVTSPITVDADDEVAPSVVIHPFFWNGEGSAGKNSLYGGLRANGHIDIPTTSGNPAVSGQISIRGTAFDDQRITALYIYINGQNLGTTSRAFTNDSGATYYLAATYSGGTWTPTDRFTSNGWKFSASTKSLTQAGHAVSWQLDWDSSKVSGVAKTDVEIKVACLDKEPNESPNTVSRETKVTAPNLVAGEAYYLETAETGSPATPITAVGASSNAVGNLFVATGAGTGNAEAERFTSRPVYTVDVVPYIRTMSRNSAFNTIRSRTGRYVFRRGETITIEGFNLYDTAGTYALTIGGVTATIEETPTPSVTSVTTTVPATASSGLVEYSVNTVSIPNNANTNTNAYNIEATTNSALDGSALWTDDRKVHVWISDNNTATDNFGYFAGSAAPIYPSMTYNDGVLYGAWANYSTSRTYYNTNNSGAATVTLRTGDPIEHGDITWNSTSAAPVIAYNANISAGGSFIDNNGNTVDCIGNIIWATTAPVNNVNTNTIYTPTPVPTYYRMESLYHDAKLMQFINQRVVSNSVGHYETYYDTDTKALKFSFVPIYSNATRETGWLNIDGGQDLDDTTQLRTISIYNTTGVTTNFTKVANNGAVAAGDVLYTYTGGSVRAPYAGTVAAMLATGSRAANVALCTITGDTPGVIASANRSAAAGEYSAIMLNSNGFPVIAYYSATEQTVKIAFAKSTTPSVSDWTIQFAMNGSDPCYQYSGKYISGKIDSSGYLHLAFYRVSTGDLVYLKSTNYPSDGTTAYVFGSAVVIDSVGSVGSGSDLSLNGTTPFISYYDASNYDTFNGLKMAYLDGTTWEYMNVPLGYNVASDVRTSIEYNTAVTLAKKGASDSNTCWSAAIGYKSDDYYRLAYYTYGD